MKCVCVCVCARRACGSLCSQGSSKIMFAWARNAPEAKLPAGEGTSYKMQCSKQ